MDYSLSDSIDMLPSEKEEDTLENSLFPQCGYRKSIAVADVERIEQEELPTQGQVGNQVNLVSRGELLDTDEEERSVGIETHCRMGPFSRLCKFHQNAPADNNRVVVETDLTTEHSEISLHGSREETTKPFIEDEAEEHEGEEREEDNNVGRGDGNHQYDSDEKALAIPELHKQWKREETRSEESSQEYGTDGTDSNNDLNGFIVQDGEESEDDESEELQYETGKEYEEYSEEESEDRPVKRDRRTSPGLQLNEDDLELIREAQRGGDLVN